MPRKTNADLAKLPKPLRIKARPIPRKHTGLAVDKEANRSDPRGAKYKTADSPLTRKQELFVKELVRKPLFERATPRVQPTPVPMS